MPDILLGASGMLGRSLAKRLPQAIAPSSHQCNLADEMSTSMWFLHQDAVETVYFAAGLVGGIEDNMARPVDYLDQNIRMGLNALKFAFKAGAKRFLNISSACAFPAVKSLVSAEDLWEGRPAETNASYGIAKRVLAEAVSAYRKQHDFDAVTVFLPNLYGDAPRKDPKDLHLIPAVIERVRRAKEKGERMVQLRGTGFEQREFMDVEDAAEALVCIANTKDLKETTLCGTGQILTVVDVAEAVKEALEWDGLFVFNDTLPSGQPFRAMNLDFKVQKQFDFKQRIKEMVNEDGQRAAAADKPGSVHEPVWASQSVEVATS